MVKISVIIPVYNVENYIEETLESLVNQTVINDIEVLMIDDGSSDDSRVIIEKYALDYDNFHAYHKENEGQGATRNYGLNLAEGEYVHFMDADDYLPCDAYEKLLNIAQSNDYGNDIILGNVLRFRRYNAWDSILYNNSFKEITHDIPSTTLNKNPSLVWDTSASNKIYKKSFLEKNNLKFLEDNVLYEDILFSFESYIHANSIAIIKDVIYYWRVRRDHTSTTQQVNTIKNVNDRLKILKLCLELMDKNNISDEIRYKQYNKWLNNDLKIYLKGFNSFPNNQHKDLLNKINEILEVMPIQIKNDLNSYLKIIYTMIENFDFQGLLYFAPLEKELKSNPFIPEKLNEKYVQYIDFQKDSEREDFNAKVFNVLKDNENLFLEFDEKINYVPDNNIHKTEALLIHEDNEFPLEIKNLENKCIVLPIDLIKDKNHLQIKIIYKTNSNTWNSMLKSERRNSISFENFDVDIGIGYRHLLYIDVQKKSDNEIEITDMGFVENEFKVKGFSRNKINQVFIQNVLSFNKIYYNVLNFENNQFSFVIPYEDILKSEVKKWELNSFDCLNSIKLSKKFKFFTKSSVITFTNTRNKILITEDILNPIVGLNDFYNKLMDSKLKYKELNKENRLLNKENKLLNKKIIKQDKEINSLNKKVDYLSDIIDEFKARKVVRLVDKFKL